MATRQGGSITNKDIARLAEAISAKNMELIAMKYLGIEWETLENLKRENKEHAQAFSREVIRKWCYMNSGPDEVKVSRHVNINMNMPNKAHVAPCIQISNCSSTSQSGLLCRIVWLVFIISLVLNTDTNTLPQELFLFFFVFCRLEIYFLKCNSYM